MIKQEEDAALDFIAANRRTLDACIARFFAERVDIASTSTVLQWDLEKAWRDWVRQQQADLDIALKVADYNWNFVHRFEAVTGVQRTRDRCFHVRVLYTSEEQRLRDAREGLWEFFHQSPHDQSYTHFVSWAAEELPRDFVIPDQALFDTILGEINQEVSNG